MRDPDQIDAVDPEEAAREQQQQAQAANAANPYPDLSVSLGEPIIQQAQQGLTNQENKVEQARLANSNNLADITANVADAKQGVAAVQADEADAELPIFAEAAYLSKEHQRAARELSDKRAQSEAQLKHLDETANALAAERLENPWAQASTGRKIATGIAAVFGAMASSVFGGPNIPLQMMSDEVKQDIERQKFNIQHGKDSVNAQKGLLGQMLAVFGDMDKAEKAAYVATADSITRRIEFEAAKSKNPLIKAKANEAVAIVWQGAGKDSSGLDLHFLQQQDQLEIAKANLAAKELAAKQAAARAAAAAKKLEFPEFTGAAKTSPEYNTLSQVYADSTNVMDEIEKLKQQITSGVIGPGNLAAFNAAKARIFNIMRGPAFAATGANLTKNEEEKIDAQLPGMFKSEAFKPLALKLLTDLQKGVSEKSLNNFIRRGYMPKDNNRLVNQYRALHGGE